MLYPEDFVNKIIQGDCLEVMKNLPDGSVDCIITDPPYGVSLKPQRTTSAFKNVKIANDENLNWLNAWVSIIYSKLKEDGFGYIFCNWQYYDIFKQNLEKKFVIKNCIVWDKMWFGMGNNWRPNHEFIIMISKKKNIKTLSNNKSNIISLRRLHPSKLTHVAEKPVELIKTLIKEHNVKAILDCFLGTGATAIACKQLGVNFIGIELEQQYIDIANERLKNENIQTTN